jgi:hypothetical protein
MLVTSFSNSCDAQYNWWTALHAGFLENRTACLFALVQIIVMPMYVPMHAVSTTLPTSLQSLLLDNIAAERKKQERNSRKTEQAS